MHTVFPVKTASTAPQVRGRAKYRCVCPTRTDSLDKKAVFYNGTAAAPTTQAQTLSIIVNSAIHRERGKVVFVRRSLDSAGRYAGAPYSRNVKTLRN